MLESSIWNPYSGNANGSRPGGGGGAPNVIKWPQLQKLVAANNLAREDNVCDDLIDCIVFRESHLGKSGVKNGWKAGFNANATSGRNGTGAKGLMQLEPCKNAGPCVDPYDPFDPAKNIQVGSKLLGAKISHWGTQYLGVLYYNGGPHAADYANDVRDCVKRLQAGDVGGAYAAATRPYPN